jgi:hypothetical protein
MIRNPRSLGLAFVAIFALCGVTVTAASADEFRSEKSSVTLTGKQDAGFLDAFNTTAGTVECEQANYSGTISATAVSSVTITPIYSECYVAGILPAVIDMNGCDYRFTLDASPSTNGTMHIECPVIGGVTQEIRITVRRELSIKLLCTIDVPEQTIGGIIYTNVGAGATREITVDINTNGITYRETEGTDVNHCNTSTLQHNGTYVGKDVITGEEDPGTGHIGIFVQ